MRLPVTLRLDPSDPTLLKLKKDDEKYGHTDETGPAYSRLARNFDKIGGLGINADGKKEAITIGDYVNLESGGEEVMTTTWLNIANTIAKTGIILAPSEKRRLKKALEAEMRRMTTDYRAAIEKL